MSTVAPLLQPLASYEQTELKNLLAHYPELIENADAACWEMLKSAKVHACTANTVLFHEGMECQHLMLIVEGSVRVYKHSDEGREVTLYRVEPGQLCIHNLNNLVDGIQFSITASSETVMRGLVISKTAFHKALAESRTFRNYVLRNLTERMAHMANLVSGFAFDRLDLRVACWLNQQFERNCGHPVQATHSDIAHELGTTREMISRILKDFEHKRCIQLARGRIHLLCKHTLHLVGEGKGKVRKDFVT